MCPILLIKYGKFEVLYDILELENSKPAERNINGKNEVSFFSYLKPSIFPEPKNNILGPILGLIPESFILVRIFSINSRFVILT